MPRRPKDIRACRRGTTLAESMIASVLLATCVVSITGALMASYQNQNFATARRSASVAGRKLMENVAAMPMDPTTAGQASIADYQTTSSQTTTTSTSALNALLASLTFNLIKFPTASVTVTSSATTPGTPAITVDRRTTLNGATSATGDFAVVTVAVPMQTSSAATSGVSSVKLKRLVTSVEAAGNQAK